MQATGRRPADQPTSRASVGVVDGSGRLVGRGRLGVAGQALCPVGRAVIAELAVTAVERAGLLVTDIEILRLHYAETLKAWRQRFLAHREEVERIYDARFVRMWEFYLAASEMAFREQALMVMQLQLTKRQGVVPITRDYIMLETARLRALERGQRPPLRLAGE